MLTVALEAQTVPSAPSAQGKLTKAEAAKALNQRGNVAQTSLASYLVRVKAETSETRPAEGSLWTENGRLARLSTDDRAMRPHDLISVVVQESLAAETDGTVANTRASSANSGFRADWDASCRECAAKSGKSKLGAGAECGGQERE